MTGPSGHRGRSGGGGQSGGGRGGGPSGIGGPARNPAPGAGASVLAVHGGYRKLQSFQVAQLVYDLTVRFCDRSIDRRSRTHDQMVQAARSGVQNIAEGSEAAATSSKMELKLTQVARASLEELKLDYEDFLRQRRLPRWERHDPMRQALVNAHCQSADDVARWIMATARDLSHTTDRIGPAGSGQATASPASPPSTLYPALSANAILTLATVAGYLLDRQIQRLAATFVEQGGFTERLHRVRTARRNRT